MLHEWLNPVAFNAEAVDAKHLNAVLCAARDIFPGVRWPQQLEPVTVDRALGKLLLQVLNNGHHGFLALRHAGDFVNDSSNSSSATMPRALSCERMRKRSGA